MRHETLALGTSTLELQWNERKDTVNFIYGQETSRRDKVQICKLKLARETDAERLADETAYIVNLEFLASELKQNLVIALSRLVSLKSDLHSKDLNAKQLRTELYTARDVLGNLQKVVAENAVLTDELYSAREEIDQLRAKQASHEQVVAEKLNTEQEFQNMKQVMETWHSNTERDRASLTQLNSTEQGPRRQPHDLKVHLAEQVKKNVAAELVAQNIVDEHHNQVTILESKLDAVRTKLRTTRSELKEAQARLNRQQAVAPCSHHNSSQLEGSKRGFMAIEGGTVVNAPGTLNAFHRGKRAPTQVGEKSMFSITPFLDRRAVAGGTNSSIDARIRATTDSREYHGREDIPQKKPQYPNAALTQELSNSDSTSEDATENPHQRANVQDRVVSLTDSVKQKIANQSGPVSKSGQESWKTEEHVRLNRQTVSSVDDVSFIKKKRKILGTGLARTIFDDEEGNPDGSREMDKSSTGALGKFRLRRERHEGGNDDRKPFSPLKRKRN